MIIANECTGGFIYQKLHKQYDNPFIWLNVLDEDFICLVQHFDNINFNKFEITFDNTRWQYVFKKILPMPVLLPVLTIDNKVRLYYTHHLYSKKCIDEVMIGNRYVSKHITDKIKERYVRQVSRMNNKKILFIFNNWSSDNHIITKLASTKLSHNTIAVSHYNINFKNSNLLLLHSNKIGCGTQVNCANLILRKLKESINNYI